MADAQAHHHVEVAAVGVEQFGLGDRVAECFEIAGADLLAVLQADVFLGNVAVLAGDGGHFEAVAFEDAGEHVGVVDEADAVGDADLLEAHALGELHDLLNPGPFAVALGLDDGGFAGHLEHFRIVVEGTGGGLGFGVDLGRAEAGAAGFRLPHAAGTHGGGAVGAGGVGVIHGDASCCGDAVFQCTRQGTAVH